MSEQQVSRSSVQLHGPGISDRYISESLEKKTHFSPEEAQIKYLTNLIKVNSETYAKKESDYLTEIKDLKRFNTNLITTIEKFKKTVVQAIEDL